ncbi:MAG: low temperature requirement protein A [Bdellovibrionaceae bacterium]|jgi:low temperature requirement protein LtrA|nr:low temperature requirement protein A [Pseudobdellovibrionaceae bacterium]
MKKLSKPMPARKKTDAHRSATELELLFDLVFVIAIALAAVGLHHAIVEAHYIDGIVKFLLAFFVLWWPWLHFTWFASAFDNDDVSYRTSVMVMMFGALLIAGGMPAFFETLDSRLIAVGYVILRLAFLFLWYRAGKENPEYGKTAQRSIWGQVTLQVCWLLLAFLVPMGSLLFFVGFGVGLILELFVPYYANKANVMPWHKHHIIERYGLLNIIVLGEILLSAALALQAMSKSGHWTVDLIILTVCATIVPFVLWWFYFCEEENLSSEEMNHVFLWGYGHFIIFASAAAIGAGFAALIDALGDHAHGSPDSARWVISISIALYLFGLWLIRDRHVLHSKSARLLLFFALLILLTPLLPMMALPISTLLLVMALVFRLRGQQS